MSPFWSTSTLIVVGAVATELTCTTREMPGLMRGPSHHVATTEESTCSCFENASWNASETVVQPHTAAQTP